MADAREGGEGRVAQVRHGRDAFLPLSAVPTLWEQPRAVIELGGGRLPRDSPPGGGRAGSEGAQQP